MRRTVTAAGPATAAEAWERYAVPGRWHEWSPPIRRVDTTNGRIIPGLAGVVHGVAGLRVGFVVEAVDEAARTWRWRARIGPLEVVLDHAVEAAAVGSTTSLTVDGPLLVVLVYPEIARLALRRLVASDH